MNVNIQTPMFQYSIFLSRDAISCLEYLSDNEGNVVIFADSYDIGPTGSLNFYRISSSEGKNIKIPIYSVPAKCWISVILINEDQRQVIFEEEPSFDYDFDDLDFIRNRNLKNPLFNEKEEFSSHTKFSDDNEEFTPPPPQYTNQPNSAPVINIQNILPENMGIQQNNTSIEEKNRVSMSDEQMNGLLSSIQQLTQLMVMQQQSFNTALELQGQHLLQMQPVIEKLASTSFGNSSVNKTDAKKTTAVQDALENLFHNIPKNVKPLMPSLYSGIDVSNIISKNPDLDKMEVPDEPLGNHVKTSPTTLSENEVVQDKKTEIEEPFFNDGNNKSIELHDKASNIDELIASFETSNDDYEENEMDEILHDKTRNSIIDEKPAENNNSKDFEIETNPVLESNESNEKNNLSDIHQENIVENDLMNLDNEDEISSFKKFINDSENDLISDEEHDYKNELEAIVNETQELMNNKDILQFNKHEIVSPSGALDLELQQEDQISKLSAEAEEILSRQDDYSDDEIETEVVKTEKEPSDELLDLLDSVSSTDNVAFEPTPNENEDEDEDDEGKTDSEQESGSSTESLDIYALLDDKTDTYVEENPIIEDTETTSNDDSLENSKNELDDLSLLDNFLQTKQTEENTQPQNNLYAKTVEKVANKFKQEEEFNLYQLDKLESLIEPKNKKNRGKFHLEDSDNQDEFVSSQVLSYVFSDLEEDSWFEVDNFMQYFEENNLHKAFGKINKDKVIYLVCKLLKNKNASPSKFVRPAIQKKLKSIMPDVAKEHWTGSISNIMDVFEEEQLLDGVNEIDICVWFVKNNFF